MLKKLFTKSPLNKGGIHCCKVPVQVEEEALRNLLNAKNIMVIGAGGEVGGCICQIAARFGPLNLLMVDFLEDPLYENYTKLASNFPSIRFWPLLGKAHDFERMEKLFDEHKPAVVIYAAGAGHKRRDLKEWLEKHGERTEVFKRSLDSNIHGLMITVSKAIKHGTKQFILISPVDIQGLEKNTGQINKNNKYSVVARFAEAWLQLMGKRNRIDCCVVRFKPPLDSSKGFLSFFEESIMQKKTLQILEEESISKLFLDQASLLSLYCGSKYRDGDVLVLDAGEIRLAVLVDNLISLEGIDCRFKVKTGLSGDQDKGEINRSKILETTSEHQFIYKDDCSFYDKNKLQREIQRLKNNLEIEFIGFTDNLLKKL
ncbi:MAG: polysaccharide biosynthesis protein [Firmicutes bacterium]|nr:polysaccharide biosynthesis protein [Bacillota bacterium]